MIVELIVDAFLWACMKYIYIFTYIFIYYLFIATNKLQDGGEESDPRYGKKKCYIITFGEITLNPIRCASQGYISKPVAAT